METRTNELQQVLVVGVKIPFWDLGWLLVKASIAAIPAAIILFMLAALCVGIINGLTAHHH